MGGGTFATTVIAVIVALMLPNIYRAEALLVPTSRENTGEASSLGIQSLVSLAFNNLNTGDGSAYRAALGLEILQSRKFISNFIESHDILVPLMAAEGWNRETGELKIDSDDFDIANATWVRKIRPPLKKIPSLQEAYEEFIDILSVDHDQSTGFVTVAVEHYSPTVAKQWTDWLVEDLNSTTMQQDVAEAEQAIAYLKRQIESTSLADLRNVFFRLIGEQTKTVMLAQAKAEYLFKTIDPAVNAEIHHKPFRALIIVSGVLLGACISVFVVMFSRDAMRQ